MRVLLIGLLLAPGLAFAQVYKCVDKDGRVTYVQTKPRDGSCEGVKAPAPPAPTPTPTPTPTPAAEGSADPLKKFADEAGQSREAEAKAREQAAQQQAQREARCAQWRQRLAALERASRVFTVDEKGERQYQSTEQNDAMREEARQGVASECG